VAIHVDIHGFDCFGTLQGSEILCGRSENRMSSNYPGRCGGKIQYIYAHTGCRIIHYEYFKWCTTHIAEDSRPHIVDSPSTVMFKMG
jgi:hypothetical protein